MVSFVSDSDDCLLRSAKLNRLTSDLLSRNVFSVQIYKLKGVSIIFQLVNWARKADASKFGCTRDLNSMNPLDLFLISKFGILDTR